MYILSEERSDIMKKRNPEFHRGLPIWCHQHGSKMQLRLFDKEVPTLVISGSAAEVTIGSREDTEGWFVNWKVVQYQPYEVVRGCRKFSDDEIAAAFGLVDEVSGYSEWLINRFGGDSAEQGKYIRWKTFLNIPCPGTGNDGDPNISIHLNDQIKFAVHQLLQ
jgi:hypothetical protein